MTELGIPWISAAYEVALCIVKVLSSSNLGHLSVSARLFSGIASRVLSQGRLRVSLFRSIIIRVLIEANPIGLLERIQC